MADAHGDILPIKPPNKVTATPIRISLIREDGSAVSLDTTRIEIVSPSDQPPLATPVDRSTPDAGQ